MSTTTGSLLGALMGALELDGRADRGGSGGAKCVRKVNGMLSTLVRLVLSIYKGMVDIPGAASSSIRTSTAINSDRMAKAFGHQSPILGDSSLV